MKLHKNNIFIIIIIILAFLIRFYQLTEESLWGDEVFSLKAASEENISNMWKTIQSENHPPLYYLLLFFWFKILSPSIFNLRLFSLIFSILSLPIFYFLTKKITNERVGLLSLTLLAFSPYHLWYAQEGRMYSLLVFFEILYLLILCKFIEFPTLPSKTKVKYIIGLIISTTLLMQSHFYSVFIVFFGIIFLTILIILNKAYASVKYLIAYLLLLFINILPSLLKLVNGLTTGKGISGLDELNIGTFKGIMLAYTYGVFIPPKSYLLFYTLLFVHLILFIIGTFDYKSAYKYFNTKNKALLYLFPILLLISSILAPVLVSLYRSIMFYGQRYLIIGTIPYYILLSRGAFLLFKRLHKPIKWVTGVLFIIILTGNLIYAIDYFNSRQKRPFDKIVRDVLDKQFTSNSAYIIEPDYLSECLNYYMKTNYIHLPFDTNQIINYVEKMNKSQKLWVISIEARSKDIEETILKHLKRGKTYFYYNEDIPYLFIRLTEYFPEEVR